MKRHATTIALATILFPVANERLTIAGVRLAALFNVKLAESKALPFETDD